MVQGGRNVAECMIKVAKYIHNFTDNEMGQLPRRGSLSVFQWVHKNIPVLRNEEATVGTYATRPNSISNTTQSQAKVTNNLNIQLEQSTGSEMIGSSNYVLKMDANC
jgi:hypothetical protein